MHRTPNCIDCYTALNAYMLWMRSDRFADDRGLAMSNATVLISGAGIAGPTLAYWLARGGFVPTVVEQAGAQRSSGSPVDVRGRPSRWPSGWG
jgi:hypothetical protein